MTKEDIQESAKDRPRWVGFDIIPEDMKGLDKAITEAVSEAIKAEAKPKLFVPISHNGGGGGKTGWAIALASSFNGQHVQFMELGGSHADRACNNMANAFLRSDCDVMLIIDIDTIFRECDIRRALAHIARGVKSVWGLYPKKQDDAPPCVNTWPEVPPPDEHGLINVRRAGRGFLCVTRGVFEALKHENGGPALKFFNHDEPEWCFFRSGIVHGGHSAMFNGEGEWISEDWMFCEDLRICLGIPTLVDTGIVLKHVGEKTYSFPAESLIRVDANIKSWREIHGWFDYEDFYRFLVKEIPDGGSFVEVGCWLGRSIAAFHEYADTAHKRIHTIVVDTFEGRPENPTHAAILAQCGGNVRKQFDKHMLALDLERRVRVLQAPSPFAATRYEDGTFDAVFIDAAHDEDSVTNDIGAWMPKVKSGGIIAGHDCDEPGVIKALDNYFFTERLNTMGRCWWVRV